MTRLSDCNSEEERAYRRAIKRGKECQRQSTEKQRVGVLAQTNVDKRLLGWFWFIALGALGVWQGWIGIGIGLAVFAAFTTYEIWVRDRIPGEDADSAEHEAEAYVRHYILADLHERGELKWKEKDGSLVVEDHPEWETFWTRLDGVINEFLKASPKSRRARIAETKRRSLPARREMVELARKRGVKQNWWAGLDREEVTS